MEMTFLLGLKSRTLLRFDEEFQEIVGLNLSEKLWGLYRKIELGIMILYFDLCID